MCVHGFYYITVLKKTTSKPVDFEKAANTTNLTHKEIIF